jgi:hypothetical protein
MKIFSAKECYRCHADCWEHAWVKPNRRGKATEVIQCVFCGVLENRPLAGPVIEEEVPDRASDGKFVFDGGRFQGKTLAEVVAHPSGKQYLDWARANVPRWHRAIGDFLDNAAPSA